MKTFATLAFLGMIFSTTLSASATPHETRPNFNFEVILECRKTLVEHYQRGLTLAVSRVPGPNDSTLKIDSLLLGEWRGPGVAPDLTHPTTFYLPYVFEIRGGTDIPYTLKGMFLDPTILPPQRIELDPRLTPPFVDILIQKNGNSVTGVGSRVYGGQKPDFDARDCTNQEDLLNSLIGLSNAKNPSNSSVERLKN